VSLLSRTGDQGLKEEGGLPYSPLRVEQDSSLVGAAVTSFPAVWLDATRVCSLTVLYFILFYFIF
jgi:hypothetical protein